MNKNIFVLLIVFCSTIYCQSGFTDYIPPSSDSISGNSLRAASLAAPLAGNFKEIVLNVSFPDSGRDQAYPNLTTNQAFPILGTFPDGTYIEDHVRVRQITQDEFYKPALEHWFKQQSGGIYNVEFIFPKKPNGESYTTTKKFSDWVKGTSTDNVIWNNWKEITDEAVINLYRDMPDIFTGINCIHLTFSGKKKSAEFHVDFGGTIKTRR